MHSLCKATHLAGCPWNGYLLIYIFKFANKQHIVLSESVGVIVVLRTFILIQQRGPRDLTPILILVEWAVVTKQSPDFDLTETGGIAGVHM